MSYESDFIKQWKTFSDAIETRIRREINGVGYVNPLTLNSIIKSEASKWTISSHYNGSWLQNLGTAHPTCSEKFRLLLQDLMTYKPQALEPASPLPFVFIGVMLLILAYLLLHYILNLSLIKEVLGMMLVVIFVTPLLKGFWEKKKQNKINQLITCIHFELDKVEQDLRSSLIVADREQV